MVLSSGGGRGVFAHTGFLQALENLDIEVAAIAGCSAGALVGGVYASGTDLQTWEKSLAEIDSREYWTPDSWLKFFWKMIVYKGRGYTGLSDTKAAIEFIRNNLTTKTFEQCRLPFYCFASNLTQGTKALFSEGELAPRIMASAAMPVLYRPVQLDGELFCDGATIELSSTEAICCRYQLDALIVHHASVCREGSGGINHALQSRWTIAEIIHLLLYRKRPWYLSNQALSFHHCRCGCEAPVIVVEPDLPEISWPLSKGGPEVQVEAQRQAEKLLQPYVAALKNDTQQLHQLFSVNN